MPSPFPGMNPYFERAAHWPDFHREFLAALRRELSPQVVPRDIVQLEEHIVLHDGPPGPPRRLGRADLAVSRSDAEVAGPALQVAEAPAVVRLPAPEAERVPYLEVRDRRGRDLVAVIELLSPSNKRPGDDREQYLAKRRELLRGPAHLVEIDLLRGGRPMPSDDRPGCDYSVLVSRAGRRPAADFWPIRLRDRLPTVAIPLRDPDGDARVDLQAALHRAHDGPGYEHFIYDGPPEPPLAAEDAAWARAFAPATP